MKKIFFFAIAILTILCTFTLILTSCDATPETETTTVSEASTETVSETTTSPTADLDFLRDYNQDASYDKGQWRISEDIYFIDGKFYSINEEVIFELNSITGMDMNSVRLLGCCSESPEGPYYIAVKSFNNIWMLTVNQQQFEYELIADDAVWESENYCFDTRTDRFHITCNNDAIQFERMIIYRSENGGLVQVDFWNDGVITKNTFESENPILITDYSGVYWIQANDFREYELTDLIIMAQDPENHPEHYINKNGELETFTIYS